MPDTDVEQELSLGEIIDRARRIAMRRRWWIIATGCVVGLGTIAVSFQLQNRYTSEATIFAIQQRVPERYVTPTATSDVSQALEAMVQEVLSRPRLLGIIQELGLYPSHRKQLEGEQLIELMRRDVTVAPIERKLGRGEINAFKVSFVADSPQVAHQVTSRLTTLFIVQNLKARSEQATTTTTFLREQLELTKNKLTSQEERLRDFKMQYLGELPEQQQGNVGILSGLETQLDNVMANRNQAQQQRLYLQSMLNEHRRRSRRPPVFGVSSSVQIVTPLEAAQNELVRMQAERRTLMTAYTAQHPDVLAKDQQIKLQRTLVDDLKAVVDDLKAVKQVPQLKQDRPIESEPDTEEDLSVLQLTGQLQTNSLEIENLNKREQKLRTEIDEYRSRLNLTPVREQQLTSLQRDYDLLRQHYGDLLKKEQESQLAMNLEKRQEGQQFRLADPPNLPNQPSSPQRLKISLIALLGGLVVGCAIAFVVEARNSSFHSEDDATSLALPIVIGVPRFFTPQEVRLRSWKKGFEWCAGFVLLCVVAAAEYFVYRHG